MKKLCIFSFMIMVLSCSDRTKESGVIKEVMMGEDSVEYIRPLFSHQGEIHNYKNGVYYFYGRDNFPRMLSDFIYEHPELELISISGDNKAGYGENLGYLVIFKKRKD